MPDGRQRGKGEFGMNEHRIIAYGEILWDLLPEGKQLGGAPFNFAYRCQSLGHRTYMISKLGRDSLGEEAAQKAAALGMDCAFIQWDQDHPTGQVKVSFDEDHEPHYDIVAGVAYVYIDVTDAMVAQMRESECICFGTLIQRAETSRDSLYRLLDEAQEATKLLDLNLRPKCYSHETITTSLEYADLLKLNEGEARYLAELFSLPDQSLEELGQALLQRWALKQCLITLGEYGLAAFNQAGEQVYEAGYSVEVADAVGAGDACTAGFISHYLDEEPLETCCRYGNALGALVATLPGATGSLEPGQLTDFLQNPPERLVHPDFAN